MLDLAHQTISALPDAYEVALGDTLEAVLRQGRHEFVDLLAAVQQSGPPAPGGATWTADLLHAELRRLGA